MNNEQLINLINAAIDARGDLFDPRHETAFRLFNGFTEGCPEMIIELFGHTLVFYNYAEKPEDGMPLIAQAQQLLLARLPWLQASIVKARHGKSDDEKRGQLIYGDKPDRRIKEHGVWYSIDLLLNRDASIYLDTSNLRNWIKANLKDQRVLNTFAYTGSLGVAAMAAGAARVVQLDLNRNFLNVAKTSYTLNGFPINRSDFHAGDFWLLTNRFKRSGELFDCVLLDPPFFSVTPKGRVDQINNSQRLINKVRPLVADGGRLVAINNALFVSGKAYLELLEQLCLDGYLKIEELIPVSADFTGYQTTRITEPPSDPAPFNHSTKIAVLRVKKK